MRTARSARRASTNLPCGVIRERKHAQDARVRRDRRADYTGANSISSGRCCCSASIFCVGGQRAQQRLVAVEDRQCRAHRRWRRIAIGSLRSIASIRARYGAYGPRRCTIASVTRAAHDDGAEQPRNRRAGDAVEQRECTGHEEFVARVLVRSRNCRRPGARGTSPRSVAARISGSALTCSPADSSESDSQRSVLSRPSTCIARWIDVTGAPDVRTRPS